MRKDYRENSQNRQMRMFSRKSAKMRKNEVSLGKVRIFFIFIAFEYTEHREE